MKELMQNLRAAALRSIAETADMEKLEAQRVKYLGKKGELTAILRQMGSLSAPLKFHLFLRISRNTL